VFDFEYKVIRRPRRKTVAIQVRDNSVMVLVPLHVSQERVQEFVRCKARWIIEKLRRNLEVRNSFCPKEYVDGEAFFYLGQNYHLKVLDGKPDKVSLKDGRFFVYVQKSISGEARGRLIVSQLTKWYQEQAALAIEEKVNSFSAQIAVQPKKVGIKNYRSRWGSCSGKGEVYFNWRLIMAPQRVVDYVVVHELCHLILLNHSKEYWKSLESVMPDYRESKEWLKINGQLLSV
jgi:predicted metal-dependent hydrolase